MMRGSELKALSFCKIWLARVVSISRACAFLETSGWNGRCSPWKLAERKPNRAT
jgi:hypothetical protein